MAIHTCPSCSVTFEVKAVEHLDYQPPSRPGEQTPVPPGAALAEVGSPTTEVETAIVSEDWKFSVDGSEIKAAPVPDEDDDDVQSVEAVDDWGSLFDSPDPQVEVESKAEAPKVTRGSWVSWGSSGGTARGKVDLIVLAGIVPGTEGESKVFGSKMDPAARVVVWRKTGGKWKPTTTKVGHKTASLRSISPLTDD